MRYDRKTGETAQLTTGFGGAVRPAVSQDGKTLIFYQPARYRHNFGIARSGYRLRKQFLFAV